MEHEYHAEIKRAVVALFRQNAWYAVEEFQLPNRRIADIAAMYGNNTIIIVEVKSTLKNCSIKEIFEKYSAFCDALYIATALEEAAIATGAMILFNWRANQHRIGYLGYNQGEVVLVRQPVSRPIATSQRNEIINGIVRIRQREQVAGLPISAGRYQPPS